MLFTFAYFCLLLQIKNYFMSDNLYFNLYEKQVNRTMKLSELLGNAIGKLRVLEAMTDGEIKEICKNYIEELNAKFYQEEGNK